MKKLIVIFVSFIALYANGVKELENATFEFGWHFFTTGNKAYLASDKYGRIKAKGVAVWEFTEERKWKPIHNAIAFDGYPFKADTFSSVQFDYNYETILFGNKLISNSDTDILANKTFTIGWKFWVAQNGLAYLSSNKYGLEDVSKGVAVWEFTEERKWKPIHNAIAFDGYPAAKEAFDKVDMYANGKEIEFGSYIYQMESSPNGFQGNYSATSVDDKSKCTAPQGYCEGTLYWSIKVDEYGKITGYDSSGEFYINGLWIDENRASGYANDGTYWELTFYNNGYFEGIYYYEDSIGVCAGNVTGQKVK